MFHFIGKRAFQSLITLLLLIMKTRLYRDEQTPIHPEY